MRLIFVRNLRMSLVLTLSMTLQTNTMNFISYMVYDVVITIFKMTKTSFLHCVFVEMFFGREILSKLGYTFINNDNVRSVINLKAFEKKSLPKWSKTIHKIIEVFPHSYKLDNGKIYKYYELQKIDHVQKLEVPMIVPTREQMIRQKTVKRKFKLTGLDLNNKY